jgi:hypothetical protein
VPSSLAIGDWVVARTEQGSLDVEYALFDASEVLLAAASAGLGVREQGYLTTASIASERLAAAGVTEELGLEALRALGSLDALARTAAIARVAGQLRTCEAFQGNVFSPTTRRYTGLWLDLDAIAAGSDADVAVWMQIVHLAAALAEMPEDTPVRLISDAEQARANQRTWRRVDLSNARALPHLLAAMRARNVQHAPRVAGEAEVDAEIVRDLRTRTALSRERPRLHALASALSKRPASNPPPSPPELIVTDQPAYDPVPLIDELRSHTELLHGEQHLREVARFLTAMASGEAPPSELAILASRAWLASGEIGYARYFARRVTEDHAAAVGARIAAVEILESTAKTNESMQPPPVQTLVPVAPVVMLNEPIPPAPRMPAPIPQAAPIPQLAAARLEPLTERPRVEVVETMSTPEGDDVRLRMTQMARELARDYRLAYGTTLKTDPIAIEAMQRHLRRRVGDAKTEERRRGLETELMRHGALLSEILARTLGARWIEAVGDEAGGWSMMVPPATRVWPIGRVYRFFEQGPRESDLVAFYFELEKSSRAR